MLDEIFQIDSNKVDDSIEEIELIILKIQM